VDMRVLGVNTVGKAAWLALAEGDSPLTGVPLKIDAPPGLEEGSGLLAVKNDVKRILLSHEVGRVRILGAEGTYQDTQAGWIPRLTLETLFFIAAAEADVDCRRLSRPKVKGLFGFDGRGALHVHAAKILEPSAPHWTKKRDLATLVALAGAKE
jgi:hypothetical protein